ncbi:MAG: hydrogenase expression/formation protein HypE [Deltaproteobacteria bacterium]
MAEAITLDHGSGGEASRELIEDIFLKYLGNRHLDCLDDSAVVEVSGVRLAMTTDSYVVDPIFFSGGNIGSLAVHGTVNDLAMQGAEPIYLTIGLILEEGLAIDALTQIIESVAHAAGEAGVQIVAGDTKVVPKGHVDKIFINTAGIGTIRRGIDVSSGNAQPGDQVLINGTIGDHGITILTQREGLKFKTGLSSDSAPLNSLVSAMLRHATALNEIADQSRAGITLFEERLPISKAVRAASEVLGLDPLYVANEGKCLIIAGPEDAEAVLGIMKKHPYGKDARIIGEVSAEHPRRALLKTRVGGTRILSMLTGEQLPRIC